jgi:phospholipase/carboxylesterase
MSPSDLKEFRAGGMGGLLRPGVSAPTTSIVLLHGYGGDEKVMWIFAPPPSDGFRVIALRGTESAIDGGYRWHRGQRWPPPGMDAFLDSIRAVGAALADLGVGPNVVWVGFSQGAALAFSCAAAGLSTAGVACLAGYLPAGAETLPPGTPVFWAHGTRDDRVPIEIAREGAGRLRVAGAAVEFCEQDVGHKLSAGCLRALRVWLRRFQPPDGGGGASVLSSPSQGTPP